jgi:hypothetical protein
VNIVTNVDKVENPCSEERIQIAGVSGQRSAKKCESNKRMETIKYSSPANVRVIKSIRM